MPVDPPVEAFKAETAILNGAYNVAYRGELYPNAASMFLLLIFDLKHGTKTTRRKPYLRNVAGESGKRLKVRGAGFVCKGAPYNGTLSPCPFKCTVGNTIATIAWIRGQT